MVATRVSPVVFDVLTVKCRQEMIQLRIVLTREDAEGIFTLYRIKNRRSTNQDALFCMFTQVYSSKYSTPLANHRFEVHVSNQTNKNKTNKTNVWLVLFCEGFDLLQQIIKIHLCMLIRIYIYIIFYEIVNGI